MQDVYYISSLDIDDAQLFAKGIRGHWSVENRLPESKMLFNMRMMLASKKAMESKHYLYSKMQPLTSVVKLVLIPSKQHQFILQVMSKSFANIVELNSPAL